MIPILASILVGWQSGGQTPANFAEIAADARVANSERSGSGVLQFHSSHSKKGEQTAQAEGTFSWRGGDGFWTYEMSDPGKRFTPSFDYAKKLEESSIEYMLITGEKLLVTNYYVNILFIDLIDKPRDRMSLSYATFFDFYPSSIWLHCCPPYHTTGRTWTVLSASDSPATKADSKTRWEPRGGGVHRYIREDSGIGRLAIDFSMELAGNVTSYAYEGESSRVPSKFATYRWAKRKDGIVVLEDCEARISAPGDRDSIVEKFEVHLSNIEIKRISDQRFSREQFQSLLPKNMQVVDRIAKKTYTLGGDKISASDGLDSLSKELRARGFAKDRQ